MHLLLHRRRRNIADAGGGNGGTFFLVSIALFVAGSFGALEVATVSAAEAAAAPFSRIESRNKYWAITLIDGRLDHGAIQADAHYSPHSRLPLNCAP